MLRHKLIATLLLVLCGLAFVGTSAQARFLQTDPVGYKDDVNWYAYVQNDALNKTDPTGMRSRLFVDESSHTITVVVPITVMSGGTSYGDVKQSVEGVSQNVRDDRGNTWRVNFTTTEGTLTDAGGASYSNKVYRETSYDQPAGGRSLEGDTTCMGCRQGAAINLGANPSEGTAAHEVAGHGSGLPDLYNVTTAQPNPNFPGNLMNNTDGTKLNWDQVKQMESQQSGNEVYKQKDRTWGQWFKDHFQ